MVNIFSDPRYRIAKRLVKKKAADILEKKGVGSDYTVNIAFVGRRKMTQLASKYKHEPIALPVLTFNYAGNNNTQQNPENDRLLGEIVICYPQAILLAAERNRTVDKVIESLLEHAVDSLIS